MHPPILPPKTATSVKSHPLSSFFNCHLSSRQLPPHIPSSATCCSRRVIRALCAIPDPPPKERSCRATRSSSSSSLPASDIDSQPHLPLVSLVAQLQIQSHLPSDTILRDTKPARRRHRAPHPTLPESLPPLHQHVFLRKPLGVDSPKTRTRSNTSKLSTETFAPAATLRVSR